MKVILYMAITANGMIAREDDSTPWSQEEWDAYKEVVEKSDAIIIGGRTYEIMKEEELDRIGNPLTIIVTTQELSTNNLNYIPVHSFEEAVQLLEQKKCQNVLINGGSRLNTLSAKTGMLDEVYLDIEPFIFGNGISLFTSENFEYKLELLDVKKLNADTIQLHYKVRK